MKGAKREAGKRSDLAVFRGRKRRSILFANRKKNLEGCRQRSVERGGQISAGWAKGTMAGSKRESAGQEVSEGRKKRSVCLKTSMRFKKRWRRSDRLKGTSYHEARRKKKKETNCWIEETRDEDAKRENRRESLAGD